ncbi:MAG: hypothetical protein O2894_07720 [Planctomycetota bacterium]|nr:hypothetical protein [Planctomycetota bacterium]
MRTPTLFALLALLALPWLASANLQAEEQDRAPVSTAERDAAIRRGLAYLDKTALRLPDVQGTPKKPFLIAVLGLDHLLASDQRSSSAGASAELTRIRAFLTRYVDDVAERLAKPGALPDGPGHFSSDRLIQYTWPVALAALFLGESAARGQHVAESRRTLAKARTVLLAAQQEGGGWGHHQTPGDAGGGYPSTLLSSSFVVATTLGLLREPKDAKTEPALTRALTYFRTAQLDNGNFPYDPSQRQAHTSLSGVSRSAGAAFALHALGVAWDDKALARTLGFVDQHFDYLNEGHGSSTLNLMYGALLQRARGERAWERFKARYFRPLVAAQGEDGAFRCICENKAFGATNDSDPFGGIAKAGGVVKQAGDPGLLERMTGGTTAAYVSAIHTFILLLDRTTLRVRDGEPQAPVGPVTPR